MTRDISVRVQTIQKELIFQIYLPLFDLQTLFKPLTSDQEQKVETIRSAAVKACRNVQFQKQSRINGAFCSFCFTLSWKVS